MADDYRTTEVGERYAQALFDLADERGVLDAVRADLKSLRAAWNESADLRRLATSPVIAAEDQQKGLVAIADAAKFNGVTRNFLGLLAQNGRSRDLPGVIGGFEVLYAKKTGVVAAEIVSAQALSAATAAATSRSVCPSATVATRGSQSRTSGCRPSSSSAST